MRTLDRNFLMNNPAGDEKAKFQVTALIPEGANVPLNPDGSRPQVTIDVEANTWMNGLTALGSMEGFSSNQEMVTWIEQIATDAEIEKVNSAKNDKKASQLLSELARKLLPEYETFALEMNFTGEDGQPFTVTIEVKAPSVAIAALALESRAKNQSLMNTAIALSPETDDDEYGDEYGNSNEVLMVG